MLRNLKSCLFTGDSDVSCGMFSSKIFKDWGPFFRSLVTKGLLTVLASYVRCPGEYVRARGQIHIACMHTHIQNVACTMYNKHTELLWHSSNLVLQVTLAGSNGCVVLQLENTDGHFSIWLERATPKLCGWRKREYNYKIMPDTWMHQRMCHAPDPTSKPNAASDTPTCRSTVNFQQLQRDISLPNHFIQMLSWLDLELRSF